MRRFLIIIPERAMLFEASGIADILAWVNQRIAPNEPGEGYRITTASTGRNRVVQGRSGLNLLCDACLAELDPKDDWDTILLTGRVQTVEENNMIVDWIAEASHHARRMASVCVGAQVYAQAGLLDNRRATTHWRYVDQLQKDYPQVRFDVNQIYVKDGNIWTSGGVSSGFDLTLALVEEDYGHTIAKQAAQELVLYLRRPGGQTQFSYTVFPLASTSGPIQKAQNFAMENLSADLCVEKLAEVAAMSPRNFSRVFAKETDTTPARFVEDIRMEAARNLVEQGRHNLEEIADACGLVSSLNLRRLFQRRLSITPSEYRERFGDVKMA